MSWLPAMMWMRMLDDDELDEQSSTGCNAGDTPVVTEIHPPVTNDTPVNSNNNNAEDAPTTANSTSMALHAMSAATFALSALLGYIATEAIYKRIRNRN
jgi:hypothetical protein